MAIKMIRLVACIVLSYTVSFGRSYPFATTPVSAASSIHPPVASIGPLISAAFNPLAPTSRPVISDLAGYNPLFPGVAGYRNPVVPGVAAYNNPLVPGVAGYNNPYYNQFRVSGAAVPILSYSSDHTGDGAYSFSFTTADGKQAQEAGYIKDAYIDNAGEPQGTQVVQGNYAYISPEGTPVQVNYIADENGFRPSGVHIPADGKAVIPVIGDKQRQILDPYGRYDPLFRHGYNGVSAFQGYDLRNSYDAAKYSPYLKNKYLTPALNKYKKTN